MEIFPALRASFQMAARTLGFHGDDTIQTLQQGCRALATTVKENRAELRNAVPYWSWDTTRIDAGAEN